MIRLWAVLSAKTRHQVPMALTYVNRTLSLGRELAKGYAGVDPLRSGA